MDRRSLFENESRRTETDKNENGEKAENPVNEDVHTPKRLCVVTKLGEESVGVRYDDWFQRLFLPDGIIGEVCPCPFDRFAGRDVVNGNDKERYCCEEWRQDKGVLPYAGQLDERASFDG